MLQWVREESLSTVQTATIVELPPTRDEVAGGVRIGDKSESFWNKISRQIRDIKVRMSIYLRLCLNFRRSQNLPHYIIHFATRFITGSYASPSSPVSQASPVLSVSTKPHSIPALSPFSPNTLVRDPFSFRQLLIASTAHGKIFALDTSTGAIVWSRVLGLGWARGVGGRIVPVKAFMVRRGEVGTVGGVQDGEGIALVAQRIADNVGVFSLPFSRVLIAESKRHWWIPLSSTLTP